MPFVNPDSWRPSGIADLEPRAWAALRHSGSASVIAGPGAGKTEFLAQRAAFLLQTGTCPPPYRILAISFKRSSAQTLAERVQARCPPEQAQRFTSMTFDAFTKNLLDRFGGALPAAWRLNRPYEIAEFDRRSIKAFLDGTLQQSPRAAWQAEIAGILPTTFEGCYLGQERLAPELQPPESARAFVMHRWWQQGLWRTPSALTFTSINRLVELLVRIHPQIRRTLQLTYPFIFVDEFQDTTYAQYDFLLSVFGNTGCKVTAVGDDKQRIMRWAGARPDALRRFEEDFAAQRFALIANYRSCPELVRIQHTVARALDDGVDEAQSLVRRAVEDDVAQIWTFADMPTEASRLAHWLREDMQRRNTHPRDYALLVRMRADQFERQLAVACADIGLRLRNESQRKGKLSLQDLLVETLTRVAIDVLRLAIVHQNYAAWRTTVQTVAALQGFDLSNPGAYRRVERILRSFLTTLRATLHAAPSAELAEHIADQIFTFLDLRAISRVFVEYSQSDNLAVAVESFRQHLADCAAVAPSWDACLRDFEGVDQIPLLTIHRSKGQEYDTVICLGLDDNSWWEITDEQVSAFFVALSRAKQRVIFTYCHHRGRRRSVATLYDLLARAGVPELPG